ncbi:hypothetical protein OEZ86_006083 [Tetradesmus obliquus]|nr:hypothetical protein OEZ86_006083 [Tetradesmus obliquus]
MLHTGPHSLKVAILKLKEGGRRVATDPNSNTTADRYLLQYGLYTTTSTDPTRAISKLHSLLIEGDLRQLWQDGKQRMKAQLRSACGYEQQQAGSKQVKAAGSRTSTAELQPLYGVDGPMRSLVMYVLAHGSRAFMTRANSTTVEGAEHMTAALAREAGRPLITVCNHVASMDDPLVMSTILPPAVYSDPAQLRWTLCASDRCFHRELLVPFFRAAKVLPVERGAGMFQPGLAAAEERLRAGDWVHIFPEGTRSRDGRMQPVRKGVGRLVAACAEADPVIVPFVHSGMREVLPKGALLPKVNQEVKVLVGEPIDVSDLLAAAAQQGWPEDTLYVRIAHRIGGRMAALKAQLDGLPPEELSAQREAQQAALEQGLDLYDPADNAYRAQSLWERVSFRMQHREWAAHGVASAKARFAAAAAKLSAAAGGGKSDGSSSSSIGSWMEAVAAGGSNNAADAAQGAGVEGSVPAEKRKLLALVTDWLSTGSPCSEPSEYYSKQRSLHMIQLLQARVPALHGLVNTTAARIDSLDAWTINLGN